MLSPPVPVAVCIFAVWEALVWCLHIGALCVWETLSL